MDMVWTLAGVGAAHLLATISPGPSFLMVARAAVGQSRAAGLMAALGMGLGSLVWALAALFGLDLLFRAAPWLYLAMKLLGAGFLLFIAVQLWRHAGRSPIEAPSSAGSPSRGLPQGRLRSLRLGLLTQLSNPKVAVFFGSIFVTLLPPERPSWVTPALLTIVFANELLWFAMVACAFSVARLRAGYLALKRWIDRLAGAFLAALGLRLIAEP